MWKTLFDRVACMLGCSTTRLGEQEKAWNLRKQEKLLRSEDFFTINLKQTANLVQENVFHPVQILTDDSEARYVLRRDLFPCIIQINYSHFKQLENKGLQSTITWYRESGPVRRSAEAGGSAKEVRGQTVVPVWTKGPPSLSLSPCVPL